MYILQNMGYIPTRLYIWCTYIYIYIHVGVCITHHNIMTQRLHSFIAILRKYEHINITPWANNMRAKYLYTYMDIDFNSNMCVLSAYSDMCYTYIQHWVHAYILSSMDETKGKYTYSCWRAHTCPYTYIYIHIVYFIRTNTCGYSILCKRLYENYIQMNDCTYIHDAGILT